MLMILGAQGWPPSACVLPALFKGPLAVGLESPRDLALMLPFEASC